MPAVRMVMFDLAGTTIRDDNCVAECLYRAAQESGLDCSLEDIQQNIGTNKRDLYRMLICRSRGGVATLADLGQVSVSSDEARLAEDTFQLYERYMLEHYAHEIQEVPGTSEVFRWLKNRASM